MYKTAKAKKLYSVNVTLVSPNKKIRVLKCEQENKG